MLKDTRSGYGLISILIHWVSALLIIFLFGLGIYMTDLTYYDEWYHKGPALHISLGLFLFALTLVRLGWRKKNATPEDLSNNYQANLAAKLIKVAFYLLIFCSIASGYFITTAEGDPASFFDWINIPSLMELSGEKVDLLGEVHEILAWIIISLACLHAAAALLHHFVMRDKTLVRMLKPVKKY
jgi:cytochrome b561